MTIAELVLALKRAAERSELGLETPVFCTDPGADDILAISRVQTDDEGDCVVTPV